MLVRSLLNAILRLDGEALVMHVGEKPYVVTRSGQVELATRGLAFDAVSGMVSQLLPFESQRALEEFGAVQHELPAQPELAGEHFTVVAARGGGDLWVEIRRRRVPDEYQLPADMFAAAPARVAVAPAGDAQLELPQASHLFDDEPQLAAAGTGEPPSVEASAVSGFGQTATATAEPARPAGGRTAVEPAAAEAAVVVFSGEAAAPLAPAVVPTLPIASVRSAPTPALVVPIARSPIRTDAPPAALASSSGLDRVLRIAAARGASTLYIASQARPSVRVDGEVQVLEGEPTLSPGDVESLLIALMPERNAEALRSGMTTEWICDLADVGRVRCMTFRDHRGAGGIFRMMPARAISADQLGLSREIQALAAEGEGLVLVAGPRSGGKSTLVSALVDLINRSRRDHVITVESEIKVVHEQRTSLVSQREVRGSSEEMAAVARAAVREDPDVLVFEELRGREMAAIALEASASGHLVIASLPAHTATAAVDRIIDAAAPSERRRVQLDLAEHLRGIVAQVLIRKPGGRVAAREVLLGTPAVAGAIAEGKTSQLTAAMEAGRRHGMVPLNDALVALVQAGSIDARDAYQHAADRAGLMALLKRHGLDTGSVERLA